MASRLSFSPSSFYITENNQQDYWLQQQRQQQQKHPAAAVIVPSNRKPRQKKRRASSTSSSSATLSSRTTSLSSSTATIPEHEEYSADHDNNDDTDTDTGTKSQNKRDNSKNIGNNNCNKNNEVEVRVIEDLLRILQIEDDDTDKSRNKKDQQQQQQQEENPLLLVDDIKNSHQSAAISQHDPQPQYPQQHPSVIIPTSSTMTSNSRMVAHPTAWSSLVPSPPPPPTAVEEANQCNDHNCNCEDYTPDHTSPSQQKKQYQTKRKKLEEIRLEWKEDDSNDDDNFSDTKNKTLLEFTARTVIDRSNAWFCCNDDEDDTGDANNDTASTSSMEVQRYQNLVTWMESFVTLCRTRLNRTKIQGYRIKLTKMDGGKTATRCPAWHIDNVPIRWLQTLVGPGTQYIMEATMMDGTNVVPENNSNSSNCCATTISTTKNNTNITTMEETTVATKQPPQSSCCVVATYSKTTTSTPLASTSALPTTTTIRIDPYLQRIRNNDKEYEVLMGNNVPEWKEILMARSQLPIQTVPTRAPRVFVGNTWSDWTTVPTPARRMERSKHSKNEPTNTNLPAVIHRSPISVPKSQPRILLVLDVW